MKNGDRVFVAGQFVIGDVTCTQAGRRDDGALIREVIVRWWNGTVGVYPEKSFRWRRGRRSWELTKAEGG